jgi:hypothetical protein
MSLDPVKTNPQHYRRNSTSVSMGGGSATRARVDAEQIVWVLFAYPK